MKGSNLAAGIERGDQRQHVQSAPSWFMTYLAELCLLGLQTFLLKVVTQVKLISAVNTRDCSSLSVPPVAALWRISANNKLNSFIQFTKVN